MLTWQIPNLPDGVVEYEVTAQGQNAANQLMTAQASTLLPITNLTAVLTAYSLYLPLIQR